MDLFFVYFIGNLIAGTLGVWLLQKLTHAFIFEKLIAGPVLSRLLATLAGFGVMSVAMAYWMAGGDPPNFGFGAFLCFLGLMCVGYFQLRAGLDERRLQAESVEDTFD